MRRDFQRMMKARDTEMIEQLTGACRWLVDKLKCAATT
jgi:hypothetical protein